MAQGAPIFCCMVREGHIQHRGIAGRESTKGPPPFTPRSPAALIAGIEGLGWKLDSADHVFASDAIVAGSGAGSGFMFGNYLFRNGRASSQGSAAGDHRGPGGG